MFLRVALAFLTCVLLALCLDYFQTVNGEGGEQPKTPSESVQEPKTVSVQSEQPEVRRTGGETQSLPLELGPAATEWNVPSGSQSSSAPDELRQPLSSGNYMTLTPTGQKNRLGNPLYELRLYAQGQFLSSFDTVSGRAHTQNRNRNQAGTEAPLPDGIYQVSWSVTAGIQPEVGERFLPLEPLFPTGRTELGLHYDPSFEKDNGEDGTSGCLALTSRQDLNQVLDYISQYKPRYLEVKIQ